MSLHKMIQCDSVHYQIAFGWMVDGARTSLCNIGWMVDGARTSLCNIGWMVDGAHMADESIARCLNLFSHTPLASVSMNTGCWNSGNLLEHNQYSNESDPFFVSTNTNVKEWLPAWISNIVVTTRGLGLLKQLGTGFKEVQYLGFSSSNTAQSL